MTNVYAPGLWPQRLPKWHTKARVAHLRMYPSVDPMILADELHIHVTMVYSLQRKLGIRRCINSPRIGDEHFKSRAK